MQPDLVYGPGKALAIWSEDDRYPDSVEEGKHTLIPTDEIGFGDLSTRENCQAGPRKTIVDPVLGLIACHKDRRNLRAAYHYGFGAPMGGGEYKRSIPRLSWAALSVFRDEQDFTETAAIWEAIEKKSDPLATYQQALVDGFCARPGYRTTGHAV